MVFTIERRLKGRRVGGRCVKQTRSRRKRKSCTRYARAGAFAQQASAGDNSKPFSGRIGKKKLSPAKCRATLIAIDAAGNRSQTKRVNFKILQP